MGKIASGFALLLLSLLHHLLLLHSAEDVNSVKPTCPQSFECGTLGSFRFPFTNQSYAHCGTILIYCDVETRKVQLGNSLYNLTGMTNDNSLEVHDQDLQNHVLQQNCLDTFENFSLSLFPFISFTILHNLTFFKCSTSLGNASEAEDYLNGGYTSYRNCTDDIGYTIYYKYPGDSGSVPPSLPHHCSAIQLPVLAPGRKPNPENPFNLLSPTFSVKYHVSDDCNDCYHRGGQCSDDGQNFVCLNPNEEESIWNLVMKVAIGILSAGVVIIIMLLCCFWRKFSSRKFLIFWKRKVSNHQNIESFLKNHGSLGPKRFTYSHIEKMTYSFKYKLGEGGYGGVYKGRLQNGQLVAVKVLKESKGNGEEFTNEVASISKTAHVNIVTLLGYCFEGSKRALVYEYMANGSLEKFLHVKNFWRRRKLDWDILYQIAVGIAQGLDYLHRGCSTRILHFDIKPHNILLDEEFCPKISDFGLSKLCLKKESIVSMLGARGTIGYIAPEICYRNFGGVSHKSDVYSYGMMVLEMVGGRKNIEVEVDRTSSELYFPNWIYKCIELNEDFGLYDATNEEENERARKMIIVGLWCIQVDPSNRPSISRVVDMLEGSLESLQMPPKPTLSSPSRAPADSSSTIVQSNYSSFMYLNASILEKADLTM